MYMLLFYYLQTGLLYGRQNAFDSTAAAAPEKERDCERRCAEALPLSSPFKQDSAGVAPELGSQKTLLTNNNL